ncbi:MAG: ABC-2 family transporter protein [Elusimicrobia bacterium]|nr:ABC-2 family transporter protein [Elusimicrobiota bacterium]
MNVARLRQHFKIWLRIAAMSLSAQLSYGLGSFGFLLGKLIRLFFFFAYLLAIFRHTDRVAGYSLHEIALFFLTFNLIDIVAMVLFRGVYAARRVVEEGDFDYHLIQPCSPLFRMAASNVDFLDLATLAPVLALLAWAGPAVPGGLDPWRIGLYALLLANGIAIALALHVFVAGVAVRTQELENTIWIYRDLMFLGKFPVDVYAWPLRWALTFLVPIGVMVSFPAKGLLGTLSPAWTAYALTLASLLMAASVWFWKKSIAAYTSVSS